MFLVPKSTTLRQDFCNLGKFLVRSQLTVNLTSGTHLSTLTWQKQVAFWWGGLGPTCLLLLFLVWSHSFRIPVVPRNDTCYSASLRYWKRINLCTLFSITFRSALVTLCPHRARIWLGWARPLTRWILNTHKQTLEEKYIKAWLKQNPLIVELGKKIGQSHVSDQNWIMWNSY
jgi:hypothetical protein